MNELVKYEDGQISVAQETLEKIKQLNIVKMEMEMIEKQIKVDLLKLMEENGIKKWENDAFTVTYVAPTKRETLDSKRLKEECPEIAEAYTKSSEVKASVRIAYND